MDMHGDFGVLLLPTPLLFVVCCVSSSATPSFTTHSPCLLTVSQALTDEPRSQVAGLELPNCGLA